MRLSEIKIPEEFKNSTPNVNKYFKCDKYYMETGRQDRYLIVDENNVLMDGYIMYLVLVNNGAEYGETRILNLNGHSYTWKKRKRYGRLVPKEKAITYKKKPTVYVYGKHPNRGDQKEYVWRLPQTWEDMRHELRQGDLIYCKTKFGVRPVVVTKIVKRDLWETALQVRKVFSRKIIRDGEEIKYGNTKDGSVDVCA